LKCRRADENNDKPYFVNTLSTKIFINNVEINGLESTLVLPQSKSVTTIRINKYKNMIDITKMNEAEYINIIDSIHLNETIMKIDSEIKDIGKLLVKQVTQHIYGMTQNSDLNEKTDFIEVCGVISSMNDKYLELQSIKDSHKIKVFFNKMKHIELRVNMIIIVKNVTRKINTNFDIILCQPKTIVILGLLCNEEDLSLKKFRYDKLKGFDCLIDLIHPIINRSISKVI
jgi:hypothetical protein